MPVMPQNAAGWRIEPPVSVPVAAGVRRPATAAALPPEEPPAMRLLSKPLDQGLITACGLAEGTATFSLAEPMANSSQLSLPKLTMPASVKRCTTVALKGER